jgi:hypothetical protein
MTARFASDQEPQVFGAQRGPLRRQAVGHGDLPMPTGAAWLWLAPVRALHPPVCLRNRLIPWKDARDERERSWGCQCSLLSAIRLLAPPHCLSRPFVGRKVA